jgi:cyanoexosortase A
LTVLALLGVPRLLLSAWEGLAVITAKAATFVIWYLGHEVELQGVVIVMPEGAVVVDQGCAGPGVISYLICLAAVFVFFFPVNMARRVLAFVVAIAIAVTINLIRVVVLAFLENAGRHDAFDFWHQGTGGQLWTMLPVLLFGTVAIGMMGRRGGRARRTTNVGPDESDAPEPKDGTTSSDADGDRAGGEDGTISQSGRV